MRRLWLAVQVTGAALVLWFVGRSLAANWEQVRGAGVTLHIRAAPLAAAALVTLATYALLIGAWRFVLAGWRERLDYGVAARIWTVSNLARYVPGRIWQIAGMAAMARQAGVSPWAAAGSAVVVQLLAIATGGLVVGLTLPAAAQPLLIALTAMAAAATALALTSSRATSLLTTVLRRVSGKDVLLEPVARGPLLLAALVTALAWVGYGVSLVLFMRGTVAVAPLPLREAVGAFTASYLLGLILVLAPGGLGVREGMLYTLLAGPLGAGPAVVVTVGSRILMTATELIAALVTLPLRPAVDRVERPRR
jgi:glycosyltransferase 2 family protein